MMRWLAILVLGLLTTGCSDYELQPLDKEATILAFGDSLTAGTGVSENESYPAVLAQLAQRRVINAGLHGENTQKGLKRLPKLLEKHQPDLVILFSGGNDFLQKVPQQTTITNLGAMIQMVQHSGAQVLLVGVPEKKLFADTAELYYQLSDEYAVPLEDDSVASLMVRASMKSDHVHFNAAGYRLLAEAIYQALQQAGALQ